VYIIPSTSLHTTLVFEIPAPIVTIAAARTHRIARTHCIALTSTGETWEWHNPSQSDAPAANDGIKPPVPRRTRWQVDNPLRGPGRQIVDIASASMGDNFVAIVAVFPDATQNTAVWHLFAAYVLGWLWEWVTHLQGYNN
jgi:hypothetical protein